MSLFSQLGQYGVLNTSRDTTGAMPDLYYQLLRNQMQAQLSPAALPAVSHSNVTAANSRSKNQLLLLTEENL